MSHEINPAILVCVAFMIFYMGWAFRAATHAKPNKATAIIAVVIAFIAVTLIICMTVLALIMLNAS
ncbi:Uncharacterised protein [Salmonella enterica subsp. enterica serovar Braenderup]|nr:hypothetical protein [Salmonella enterica subsp. enterica serovar Braenderup]SUH57014.1 Uncharacterised protein [Salmonella enterica subsp. enterica serovar Braenderup]